MARDDSRGFGDPVVILLTLGTASVTIGGVLYANPQDGGWWFNPTPWFVAAVCFFCVAILVTVFSRLVLPYFRKSREEDSLSDAPTKITVRENPETTIQDDKFRERPLEVEVENPPDNLKVKVDESRTEKRPGKIDVEKLVELSFDPNTSGNEEEADGGDSQDETKG